MFSAHRFYNRLSNSIFRVVFQFRMGEICAKTCLLGLLVSLCCFSYRRANAQYDIPQNRIWAFGIFAGLDFNAGSPVPIQTAVSGAPNSSLHTGQASVAVSDRNGQLLFYTNGSHVWDRNHALILPSPLHNGALNLTPVTQVTTQGTLVVPVSGNPDQYYIFSLTHPGNHAPLNVSLYGKLYYSVLDMRLNGGLGGIVPGRQWQLIASDLSDKMIAIPSDHCSVWLLVHSIETNTFQAFEIDASGISSTPVVSNVGSSNHLPAPGGRNQYWIDGQMAISHDFKKLAIAATMGAFAEVFDFDPATGIVSNPYILDTGSAAFGLAFSPDNSKLYMLAQEAGSPSYSWHLFQYDLSAGSPAAIRQTKTKISTNYMPRTQLKLGPDKRLYFGNNINPANNLPTERGRILGAVLLPDNQGSAANFVPQAVELLNNTSMIYGLSHEVTKIPDSVFSKKIVNRCNVVEVLTAPSNYDFYEWYDGSTGNSVSVSAEGVYWVRGKKGCVTHVDTFVVRNTVTVSLGPDTVVCFDPQPITLRPNTDKQIETYLWSNGNTSRTLVVRASGKYWVTIVTREGCVASDTIDIQWTHLDPQLGDDTVVCGLPSPLLLTVDAPEHASFLWSNGDIRQSTEIKASGDYWVEVQVGACMARDTIGVKFIDLHPFLGKDQILCREDPILVNLSLDEMPLGSITTWSDGSNAPAMVVRDTGQYWVEVRNAHCVASDTIVINSEFCDCVVNFPSAFTPNGDGLNDIFRPVISEECQVSQVAVVVYNRWGQEVFQSRDLSAGWDGTFNGLPADIGVYMFRAKLTVGTDQREKLFTGDLTLIR